MRILLLAGALWAAVEAIGWALFPLRVCPRCKGAKELADGRNRRVCPRCGGTGRVKRFGRK